MNNSIRTPNAGIECERCGFPSELRTHTKITEKQLKQPFYYKQWYFCPNKNCQRTTFMKDEDRVFNKNDGARYVRNKEELEEQESLFHSIMREK